MKLINLAIFVVLLAGVYAEVVSPHYEQGNEIGPRWAPKCQHILHCQRNAGRSIDVKVDFKKPFANPPKVIIATRLYDLEFGGPNGYFMEAHEITNQGFKIRYTAASERHFYTNLVRYLATDDPRVHVQYFETTDMGPIAKGGNAVKTNTYKIPIVGFQPQGQLSIASFEQGIYSTGGHCQIRQHIVKVQDNQIFLKAVVWWFTTLSKFRVGFIMMSNQFGWASKPIIGDWGAAHPFIKGNGGRDVPAKSAVPPRFGGDPDLVQFSGIVGYLAWTTHDRKANLRIQFHSEKIEGNVYSFKFNTWANSQTRIIEVQLFLLDGGYRYSNKDCAVIFNECNFEGDALEICDHSNDFATDGFSGSVRSVSVPPGKTLKLYDEDDLEGKSALFPDSVSCISGAINFKFIQLQDA